MENYYMIFNYIYLFILGSLLGSFYNVVGIRVPNGQSINDRSKCPKCNENINGIFLMPVIGYLISLGKCIKCKGNIHIKYILAELITGLLFIFMFYKYSYSMEFLQGITIVSLLIILSVADIHYKIVPDSVLVVFLVLGIINSLANDFNFYILGGIIGFSILYLIGLVGFLITKKEALGGGDIKLYGVIGLFLGVNLTLLSLFLASFYATVIMRLINKGKDGYIPFVPFISLGVITSFIYGESLINWYFNLF